MNQCTFICFAAKQFLSSSVASSVSLQGFYQHGRESLLAQVKGSLKHSHGFQLAVSADLRNSIAIFAPLPPVLGLDATLQHSDVLTDGRLSDRHLCNHAGVTHIT